MVEHCIQGVVVGYITRCGERLSSGKDVFRISISNQEHLFLSEIFPFVVIFLSGLFLSRDFLPGIIPFRDISFQRYLLPGADEAVSSVKYFRARFPTLDNEEIMKRSRGRFFVSRQDIPRTSIGRSLLNK